MKIPINNLRDLNEDEIEDLLYRYGEDFSTLLNTIIVPIIDDVKHNGDSAVKFYTKKFDAVELDSILVTPEEIEQGARALPHDTIDAFLQAKANIEDFHRHQRPADFSYTRPDGTALGVQYQPIDHAAIYVPGGKAAYPSSVLMGIIPAQIAGVPDITIITPPNQNGGVADSVLAMAHILGIKKIVKSGGAHGIAAAGFGTESAGKADIIIGPGNIYVTAAKTYLYSLGVIQIDSIAGPSEILIIADDTANPEWIACDLLSQAEHDEMAISILVTTSTHLAEQVAEEIKKDLKSGSGRHDIKKKSIESNCRILVADSILEAIAFSNRYAPEHMEFMVKDPMNYLPQIRNVGSLFLGQYAPVAVGDYFSGTNHILPTGGSARFSSGVSVETFLRRTTWQHLSADALKHAGPAVQTMARAEGFDDKHGGSVRIRF